MNNSQSSNTELNLDAELSFIGEFELSKNGMVKEVKTEFDIVRFCITEADRLGPDYQRMFDRILVMPIRKLLCEKSSILLILAPDFKMPLLTGFMYPLNDKLYLTRPSLEVSPKKRWVLLKDWLEQDVAYFDRAVDDLPDIFPEFIYQDILNKLKKTEKLEFEAMYKSMNVDYKGQPTTVYTRNNPKDIPSNNKIFNFLKKIGYNNLSAYNFLKHQSDKRGAHIDIGHSLLVEMVNNPISNTQITLTLCIALQMIYAAKIQIPELSDYWVEMPELNIANE